MLFGGAYAERWHTWVWVPVSEVDESRKSEEWFPTRYRSDATRDIPDFDLRRVDMRSRGMQPVRARVAKAGERCERSHVRSSDLSRVKFSLDGISHWKRCYKFEMPSPTVFGMYVPDTLQGDHRPRGYTVHKTNKYKVAVRTPVAVGSGRGYCRLQLRIRNGSTTAGSLETQPTSQMTGAGNDYPAPTLLYSGFIGVRYAESLTRCRGTSLG